MESNKVDGILRHHAKQERTTWTKRLRQNLKAFGPQKIVHFKNSAMSKAGSAEKLRPLFIMGRSHRLGGHKTRMKFEHCVSF